MNPTKTLQLAGLEDPDPAKSRRLASESHGKHRIGRHSGKNPGFTLIELLIVIAILLVLAAIVFVASRKIIASARTATCLSNIRQMHAIATMEATDRGFYPPMLSQTSGSGGPKNNGDTFYSLIDHQTCASCPEAKFKGTNPKTGRIIPAYGANPTIMGYHVTNESDGSLQPPSQPYVKPHQILRPSEVFLMTDGAQFASGPPRAIGFSARWYGKQTGEEKNAQKELTTAIVPASGFWDDIPLIPFRHDGKACVIFVDGHAITIRRLGDLKEKNIYWNY